MNNKYLAINVFKDSTIKSLYVIDFDTKLMYCGVSNIGGATEVFDYNIKKINSTERGSIYFDYFFLINDKNVLSKILDSSFTELSEMTIEQVIQKFGMIEWSI
jgi:hypothetical protein